MKHDIGPSLEEMKNAIKGVEDIPCEVDETARAVLLDGIAMFKNVYGGGDNDYEVIVRDKKNGKFKSSDADLAAAAKCFVKYYKEHSVSTKTPKKYDRVPFDELGKVSCDDWFHRPFKVKYGAAVVEFSRSDYFEHDAFLLTDGTMERLCLRIQEELAYYSEVDRIAREYTACSLKSSGVPLGMTSCRKSRRERTCSTSAVDTLATGSSSAAFPRAPGLPGLPAARSTTA